MTQTDNRQLNKPASHEVDDLAHDLSAKFNNTQFLRWYCGVIYDFGVSRTKELAGRTDGVNYPGKLFSTLVSDERSIRKKNRRLYGKYDP